MYVLPNPMAPCRTTSGVPSPTMVQAISMSPTGTVLLVVRMMASSVGTVSRSVARP